VPSRLFEAVNSGAASPYNLFFNLCLLILEHHLSLFAAASRYLLKRNTAARICSGQGDGPMDQQPTPLQRRILQQGKLYD
jgi:hypothetical protein